MKTASRKIWVIAGVLGVTLAASSRPLLKLQSERARQARMALQGKPWNGGKPTAPIELESSIEGEIPRGEWVDLELALIPSASGCIGLSSRVRPLDGLEVSDDSVWSHPVCAQGERILRQLRVRAEAGVSGLLAVDLRMEMDSGEVFEVTRSVALRAEGASSLPSEPGSQ